MNVHKLKLLLFYIYLLVFPLGQLLRIDIFPEGNRITVLAVDLVVFLITGIYFLRKPNRVFKIFTPLVVVFMFSYVFSYTFLPINEMYVGLLYLLRLCLYVGFYRALSTIFRKSEFIKNNILNWLSDMGLIIALFGLLQYVFLPDLRSFVSFGWDAHLFRLAGTFFDPGFTGILLVLAFIVIFYRYSVVNSTKMLMYSIIVLLALILTYSRASYLAFAASALVLLLILANKARKTLIVLLMVFLVSIPFLPRPEGVGVRLERTHSIYQRVENYNETIDLIQISPLWGIGYNNLCSARLRFDIPEYGEHSCSGADSSFLFILVTTGVVGAIIVLHAISLYLRAFWGNPVMITSLVAVLIHSNFQNSLFYPWVLGWFVVIIAYATSAGKRNTIQSN